MKNNSIVEAVSIGVNTASQIISPNKTAKPNFEITFIIYFLTLNILFV